MSRSNARHEVRLIYRSHILGKITYVLEFVHSGINPGSENKSLENFALTLVSLGFHWPNYLSGGTYRAHNKFPELGLAAYKASRKICHAKLLVNWAR